MAALRQLEWRPFTLPLRRPLVTARGGLGTKRGWLLRLLTPEGAVGWGEAAPLDGDLIPLERALPAVAAQPTVAALEALLPSLPLPLAFALGAALAEIEGLPARRWRPAPAPARLLPAGEAALAALAAFPAMDAVAAEGCPPVFKWKVAVAAEARERQLLELLLQRLPSGSQLRLDANGGWDRPTAGRWAERLVGEPRLAWLEQPLAANDRAGLMALAERFPSLPLALDESLVLHPEWRGSWRGWQVRRPSQEGDPRPLLVALEQGQPGLMLSTAFETGIGARWLAHLAALQAEGPTPAAPGLAPGWLPQDSPLLSADPAAVWQAAAAADGR
jgi:O-succinylbenzoate synthase